MLSLHTNAASLSTQNSLSSTNKALSSSMTRLGTGFRVNSAMDDAAGLQIATRLNAQTRGMQVAQKNTQNGISMLQTAEGALSEVSNILLRMKDLATESGTASTTDKDRVAMQAEFDALGAEMNNILGNTAFGGAKLFSSKAEVGAVASAPATGSTPAVAGSDSVPAVKAVLDNGTLTFQIGSSNEETMEVDGATGLGKLATALESVTKKFTVNEKNATAPTIGELTGIDSASTASVDDGGVNARAMITTINDAINEVASFRSELGASANRLEHTYNNLGNMIQNTQAAQGRIMDVDYATETSNMTSKQMLMQASTSMLKQSNSMSQMVASLLQ